MSSTHTLYIKDIRAILQLNVEHSAVSYTLTLLSDLGERVTYSGHQPNVAMDQFMVIDQYVKNTASVTTAEQGVQTCLEQSVKDHIISDIDDFIAQGQKQEALIQENQLHQSHTNITVPNESLESDNFSPILPSSPKYAQVEASFEQELQDLSNKKIVVIEEPIMAESLQSERMIQFSGEDTIQVRQMMLVQEEALSQRDPFNEVVMMEQLQNLRTYSNPDIKHGIVQAVQDYLSENNINLLDYSALCEFMKELFYEMIVLHVDDDVLVGKFIKMLYLAGEQSDDVPKFVGKVWSQYALFCKVATHYKIKLEPTSFADYWKWNATQDGPVATRYWHQMKTFLLP